MVNVWQGEPELMSGPLLTESVDIFVWTFLNLCCNMYAECGVKVQRGGRNDSSLQISAFQKMILGYSNEAEALFFLIQYYSM